MFLYFTGKMAGRNYIQIQTQTFKQIFLNSNIPELLPESVERGHL